MGQRINSPHLFCCIALVAMCACDRRTSEIDPAPESDDEATNLNCSVDPDEGGDARAAGLDTRDEIANQVASKYEDIPNGKPIIHQAAAGELQNDGWCVAESTRGNFQVELPGNYVDHMIKELGTNGAPGGMMHSIGTITEEGVEFNVLQTEAFGPLPKRDMCLQMANKFKNKGADVKTVDVEIDGCQARKLVATHPTIAAEMVFLSVEPNQYMISVQFPPQLHQELREDIDRFYRSFIILNSGE